MPSAKSPSKGKIHTIKHDAPARLRDPIPSEGNPGAIFLAHIAPYDRLVKAKVVRQLMQDLGWQIKGSIPEEHASSAIELLDSAADHQRERASKYDQPSGERSMDRTVRAFNIISRRDNPADKPITESEGWMFMQLLKDVRDRSNGPHRDSLEDCVSYSSLKAEARLKEIS